MSSSVDAQIVLNIPQRPFLFSSIKKRTDIPEEQPAKIMSNDCSHHKASIFCGKTILHVAKLFQQIWQSYDNGDLVDVRFKVAHPPLLVPAHRLILSAASPYFKELFRSAQGTRNVIEINQIDSDTFERLVAFCYTGTALIIKENVEKMLRAAMLLKLEGAIASCVDFLMDNITIHRMERFYGLEHETKCTLLAKRIQDYEINNFSKICRIPHFIKFDAKKLQTLVESNNLDVSSEEDVLKAIESWYNHDVNDNERQKHLPNLIACLRLTLFDADILLKRIRPLPGCELLSYKALSWINEPLLRKDIPLKFTEPREGLGANWGSQALMAIQIDCSSADHGYIYHFNKKKDIWVKWDKIQIDALNFEVILVEDDLYFIGGKRNYNAINVVRKWNLRTKTWKSLPELNYARYWSSVALLDGKIYVMGGVASDEKVSQSVEVYTKNRGWEKAANLITPRYGASAVTLNGEIYLMGGYGDGDLQCVERYSPKTNKWTPCAPLLSEHYLPGVAVHNRHIYVIGGWIQDPDSVVERYDVRTNKWTKVCTLTPGRWGVGCSLIDREIWTIGGGSQTQYTNNVTVYDTKTNKWTEKKSLPRFGIYYSFTVSKTLLKEEIRIKEKKEDA